MKNFLFFLLSLFTLNPLWASSCIDVAKDRSLPSEEKSRLLKINQKFECYIWNTKYHPEWSHTRNSLQIGLVELILPSDQKLVIDKVYYESLRLIHSEIKVYPEPVTLLIESLQNRYLDKVYFYETNAIEQKELNSNLSVGWTAGLWFSLRYLRRWPNTVFNFASKNAPILSVIGGQSIARSTNAGFLAVGYLQDPLSYLGYGNETYSSYIKYDKNSVLPTLLGLAGSLTFGPLIDTIRNNISVKYSSTCKSDFKKMGKASKIKADIVKKYPWTKKILVSPMKILSYFLSGLVVGVLTEEGIDLAYRKSLQIELGALFQSLNVENDPAIKKLKLRAFLDKSLEYYHFLKLNLVAAVSKPSPSSEDRYIHQFMDAHPENVFIAFSSAQLEITANYDEKYLEAEQSPNSTHEIDKLLLKNYETSQIQSPALFLMFTRAKLRNLCIQNSLETCQKLNILIERELVEIEEYFSLNGVNL